MATLPIPTRSGEAHGQNPQAAEPDAALDALATAEAERRILTPVAGGTDLFPALVARPAANDLLDLSDLPSLKGISVTPLDGVSFLRIGAMTPWSTLADAAHPALREPAFEALVMAAGEVGGRQIQNRGTLGGNLCNASPAADGVPALAALEARVQLRSAGGVRTLAVDDSSAVRGAPRWRPANCSRPCCCRRRRASTAPSSSSGIAATW
ncbi:MAG: FAD binding domain-containing protein [Burkholderiaceae bacterium]